MSSAKTADTLGTDVRDQTHSTVTWRLMPLLLICYLFAHLDRINIGFAKMQMSADLNFSDTVYGFGAGLFFVAYALFGVPSNMALDRVGPRRWIAALMVVWGALSTCMFLIDSDFDTLLGGTWSTALGGNDVNGASLSRANAISYTSPTFGGFSVAAGWGEDGGGGVALGSAGGGGGVT